VLGIEEAEGVVLAEVGRESVEKGLLVLRLMNPGRRVTEIGFAISVGIQLIQVCVFG